MRNLLYLTMAALLLGGCGGADTPTIPERTPTTAMIFVENHGPCLGPGVDLSPSHLEWSSDFPMRVGVDYQLNNYGCDNLPSDGGRNWVGVIYKVDGPSGGWYYDYHQIPHGGHHSNIGWDCYVELPGTYEITVEVDYRHHIKEFNENNNDGTTGKFKVDW